jgi:DMSO/TMAO reductase YedYZ heme-binding membrane subunit
MSIKKEGALAILGIFALSVSIAFLVLPDALEEEPVHTLVRLFALYGYLFLSIATLTTPFLKEITQFFGAPFLKVHHAFAALGLTLITMHPVSNAIQRLSLSVFIPNFSSWDMFWLLAGRPALIILYAAVFFALVRSKALSYWRPFHALMYIALLFGLVHGSLIGEDFQNQWIMGIFAALFILCIASFAVKRFRTHAAKSARAKLPDH